ncbi:hypothetical protein DITRI_Ditri09bG0113800 [Diplodiscus trichospermus]
MEAGDEGIDRVVDSKDLQQQSKAFGKLTDRVEVRQLDSSRAQSVLFLSKFMLPLFVELPLALIAASAEVEKNAIILRFDFFFSFIISFL